MALFQLVGPLLRCLDAETAHRITIRALKSGLVPRQALVRHDALKVNLWGMPFPNPLGLAAGFDKNAEVPDVMLAQGFGFVEVGSITPRPQLGNPKPRLFRLPENRGIINRMGFNNLGVDAVGANLESRRGLTGIVGVNLGKNKDTENAAEDYVRGINALAVFSSYIVVNVSSPNTPGLRTLQGREPLEALLNTVRQALDETVPEATPPLLLKVAPDLTDEDKSDIATVVRATGVDGLIATNTTISRPLGLLGPASKEAGGLSGEPLNTLSSGVISDMYQLLDGQVPIIGVGGVHCAGSAYAKIRAGASLVQLYSALVYQGPELVREILTGLIDLLSRDGFSNVSEAVGADHR